MAACETKPREIPVAVDRPIMSMPEPLNQEPVTWRTLTPQVVETLPPGWVYFALSPEEFERFVRNDTDTTRWIGEARGQLQYYRGEDDKPAQ